MNKNIGEQLFSLLSFLENKENFYDMLEYVFDKFYNHSLSVLKNKNEDKFITYFLADEYSNIIYIDTNTFLTYMLGYFQAVNKENLFNENLMKILSVTKIKSSQYIEKQKKIFWIGYMRYLKNFLTYTGSEVNLTKHGFFTLIVLKNENENYGVLSALSINVNFLENYDIEAFYKLRELNISSFKIAAFNYKKIRELEKKQSQNIKYIYELNKILL